MSRPRSSGLRARCPLAPVDCARVSHYHGKHLTYGTVSPQLLLCVSQMGQGEFSLELNRLQAFRLLDHTVSFPV